MLVLHPAQGTQFSVILTEGRPDETGITTARAISDLLVPTSVILDSGVGYCMDRWERMGGGGMVGVAGPLLAHGWWA